MTQWDQQGMLLCEHQDVMQSVEYPFDNWNDQSHYQNQELRQLRERLEYLESSVRDLQVQRVAALAKLQLLADALAKFVRMCAK